MTDLAAQPRTRSRDELLAHARQIGTGHGVADGEEFELDAERAAGIITVFSDPKVFVDFRDQHRRELTAAATAAHPAGEGDPYDAAVFQPLGITPDHPDAADVRLAYDQSYNDAMCQVVRRRAALMTDPPSASAPHGYHKIRVVLTATSNPYLAGRLPLAGELEVFETTVDHFVMPNGAVFRVAKPDGTLGAPVEVRDIAYLYDNRVTQPATIRPDAEYEQVFTIALHYAWGRSDQAGDALTRRPATFVGTFAATWVAIRDGRIPGDPAALQLRAAYDNWLRNGTLFSPAEDTTGADIPAATEPKVETYTHWAYFALPEHAKACAAELRETFAAQTRIDKAEPPTLPRQQWLLRAVTTFSDTQKGFSIGHNEVEAIVQRHEGSYDSGDFATLDIETGAYIMPRSSDRPLKAQAGGGAGDAG